MDQMEFHTLDRLPRDSISTEHIKPLYRLPDPASTSNNNIPMTYLYFRMSRPIYRQDAVRYICPAPGKVVALQIQRNLGVVAQLLHLSDAPVSSFGFTGYSRSVFVGKSVVATSYASDSSDNLDPPRPPLMWKHGSWEPIENWNYQKYVDYCEELGRIVFRCRDYVVIELTG
jgi:hypothetical protein